MGLFDKLKKKENDEKALKQDLSNKDENNQVFIVHLLMKEKVEMPSREFSNSTSSSCNRYLYE